MSSKPFKDGDVVDEREFRDTIKDVVSSQSTIAQSQARMEGSVEGIRQTLNTLIAAIGDVSAMRVELAKLQERDRHPDPQLAIFSNSLTKVEEKVATIQEKEQRHWIEGIAKLIAAGGAGGAMTFLVHKLTGG